MLNDSSTAKVCVTGGAGYIGSWLVKKLLTRGYVVHVTLRNLGEASKVDFLKSLPGAEARLFLFEADIYNPHEFETAIRGCQYVFHVATPKQHPSHSTEFKDTIEAAVAGVRSIANACIRSQTVKRLIYTASTMSTSPLKEDGSGHKSCFDESCWTPLNLIDLSFDYCNQYTLGYTASKTQAEKEALRFNEIKDCGLEVVSLACGLVGGDTLLPYAPFTMQVILSPLTGNPGLYNGLAFMQEVVGSIPLVHIDDVCEAHIFCMERESMKGRFICAVGDPTIGDIANHYQQNFPQAKIAQESVRQITCFQSSVYENLQSIKDFMIFKLSGLSGVLLSQIHGRV
uniref:NAD-dependent epimerase/dehydratase domain-containing protein n=1 Tax=Kalanchoe fedtschenkoi TaxID=63787 RepID=A0A7N0V686_KALFE